MPSLRQARCQRRGGAETPRKPCHRGRPDGVTICPPVACPAHGVQAGGRRLSSRGQGPASPTLRKMKRLCTPSCPALVPGRCAVGDAGGGSGIPDGAQNGDMRSGADGGGVCGVWGVAPARFPGPTPAKGEAGRSAPKHPATRNPLTSFQPSPCQGLRHGIRKKYTRHSLRYTAYQRRSRRSARCLSTPPIKEVRMATVNNQNSPKPCKPPSLSR